MEKACSYLYPANSDHGKRKKPDQIICLCGCMAQEPHVADRLRQSYRHVDLVFGPQQLWRFPELLRRVYLRRGRVFETEASDGAIAEGLPVRRSGTLKAWVSIMYGCNNFCSYCIVPYVRGRERSREPDVILREIRELARQGYKDITLQRRFLQCRYTVILQDIPTLP